MDSILISVKKVLGSEKDYKHFDADITMHINSVLMALSQIGVGPPEGFIVKGETETWSDYLGDRKDLESVKSYIYMKTRLLFDPPSSSFVVDSMERLLAEYEWRLSVQV